MVTVKLVAALAGVVVALGIALVAGALIANRVPLGAPPGPGARLLAYLTTNVARTAPDAAFPELRPREIGAPAGEVHARAVAACRALGWEVVESDAERGSVAAVVTTPLLGFRDDVAIGVEPLGPGAARVDVRSSSRVGRGDLGANLRHVLDLLDALENAPGGG